MLDDKFYVKKIVRDDGASYSFDGQQVYLSSDNVLLTRPEVDSTDTDYTDSDGGEMIRQKLPPFIQLFSGIIYPRTSDYWTLYFSLTSFFIINHTYKVVYKKRNGDMFAQHNAWIAQNIQVSPNSREEGSVFTIGLKVSRMDLVEYAEDGSGNEIYKNSAILPLLSASSGGQIWDSVGQVFGTVGQNWESGNGGVQQVTVNSVAPVYPRWTVVGPSVNPKLQNNTTDTVATYNGTVASGQTLVVDFSTGEARLDTALVSRNISGQVKFIPGHNIAGFNSDGGSSNSSKIEWNNILG